MPYAQLTYTDETAGISPDERSRRAAAFTSFQDQMHAQGVLLASERLHPAETATTARAWEGGGIVIGDGSFAEIKEQMAGLFIVDCTDLDEALEVAVKIPRRDTKRSR